MQTQSARLILPLIRTSHQQPSASILPGRSFSLTATCLRERLQLVLAVLKAQPAGGCTAELPCLPIVLARPHLAISPSPNFSTVVHRLMMLSSWSSTIQPTLRLTSAAGRYLPIEDRQKSRPEPFSGHPATFCFQTGK